MAKLNHQIIVFLLRIVSVRRLLLPAARYLLWRQSLRHDWKPGGLQAAGGDRQVPLGRAGLPAQQEHHPLRHRERPAGLQLQ